MALCKTGTFTTSGGIFASVRKHLKFVSLQPAKKVQIKFDPFGPNSQNIRNFIFHFNDQRLKQTNPNCKITTEVICDRSEPTVDILLTNGDSVLLKCNHLTILDIIKLFNEHVSSLVPKAESAVKKK